MATHIQTQQRTDLIVKSATPSLAIAPTYDVIADNDGDKDLATALDSISPATAKTSEVAVP